MELWKKLNCEFRGRAEWRMPLTGEGKRNKAQKASRKTLEMVRLLAHHWLGTPVVENVGRAPTTGIYIEAGGW